jgi:hypothetical protein
LATGIENALCEALATRAVDAGREHRCHRVSAGHEMTGMLDVAAFAASVTAGSSRHWRILPAFL